MKNAFQTGQNNEAFPVIVIVDNPELDLAIALLRDGGLSPSVRRSKPHEAGLLLRTFSGKGTTLGFPSASGVIVSE